MPSRNNDASTRTDTHEAGSSQLQSAFVVAVLVIHAGLLAFGAGMHSPTPDEPMHLAAGIYQWQYGSHQVDHGNPPLVDLVSALPVLLAAPATDWQNVPQSFQVGSDFVQANDTRCCWLITLGRWACIPFSLVGGYVCFRWARELYGYASGLLGLMMWCFSPLILAHGQLITGDLPATATGVAALYSFWCWLSRPSWPSAAVAGLVLGLAQLSKYVCVLFYPLLPLLWLIWRLLGHDVGIKRSVLREIGQLTLIVLGSLYVINLGYAFESPFQPLDRFETGRRIVDRLTTLAPGSGQSAPARIIKKLGSLPLPLPENYVAGVEEISEIQNVHRRTYLCGQWRVGGWWYWYPYAFALKVPLGTLGLLALAWVGSPLMVNWKRARKSELLLLLTVLALLWFMNFVSFVPQRIRYGLPILPFLLIWASKTGAFLVGRRRLALIAAVILFVWSVASSLWIYPHSLSYFNELTGGPLGGHAHLRESNIDWGQDLIYLKRWLLKHPEVSSLGLSRYARSPGLDSELPGLEFEQVPPGPAVDQRYSATQLMALGPRPGWYAVSVDQLRAESKRLAYFFCFRPVATAGYSIYIYHITPQEANRVRSELNLPRLPEL